MPVLAHQAALSMALGAFLYWLLGSGADAAPRSPARRAAGAVLLLLLAWQTVGCCWLPSVGSEELAPALSLAAIERGAGLCALLGAAAYLSRRASLAPEGLLTGLLFALLGVQAAAWARVFQVWRLLGSFSGTFFGALEPAALAASCALLALILRHEDSRPHRWRLAALALLLWAAPAQLELWRLSSRYGLARRSLAEDAGLKSADGAERISLAWLYPDPGKARFETRRAVVLGVNVSPENLAALHAYLVKRGFQGVFARQAVAVLRRGWLFWWQPDRALLAAMLQSPGRLAPDYLGALDLLRSGRMDRARYGELLRLSLMAQPRKEGFEQVDTSQLIFQGFASAFARFGDQASARPWLLRVDNLWPIYVNKVEVSPVESVHDCRVDGSLLVDGSPSPTVKVGLFYVAGSTAEASAGWLSQSVFPDREGRFSFGALAPGDYYLGLMGLPSQLRGQVLGSPGMIELTAESPEARLKPIRVERSR